MTTEEFCVAYSEILKSATELLTEQCRRASAEDPDGNYDKLGMLLVNACALSANHFSLTMAIEMSTRVILGDDQADLRGQAERALGAYVKDALTHIPEAALRLVKETQIRLKRDEAH